MENLRRVLVIGAGGGMARRFLEGLSTNLPDDIMFELSDIDVIEAARSSRLLPDGRGRTMKLDLFDEAALRHAMSNADLVVNGAGPFHRTAEPVRRAAIDARVNYLDIDDDTESTLDAVKLDEEARRNGVALFVGCGASPGLTNILARDLAERLDTVSDIDVVWCVGDEGRQEHGRSVIAHTLHMGAGTYTGWREGQAAERSSYVHTRRFALPKLESQPFYECAHPEPAMLGRTYPGLRSITCWGTLHPAPLNGMVKGVAEAVDDGRITEDDAITYLQNVIAGRAGDQAVEAIAMDGVSAQVRRGEISYLTKLEFIIRAVFGLSYPTVAGTAAFVRGTQAGKPVCLMRYLDSTPANAKIKRMEYTTGYAQAAFFLEAIHAPPGSHVGCLFPEQWVEPETLYERLALLLGQAQSEWLSPVRQMAWR